jgi:hemolysin activation/secretion protein
MGAGVLLPITQTVYAQVPDAGALQQQLQREADRANVVPPPENLIKKKEKVPAPAKGSESIDVNTFTITGVTLISQEAAKEAVAPYK